MSEQIKVTWEVEDGYCGKSRPQYTYIDKVELDECRTEEERQNLIDTYVQEEYDQLGFAIENIEED